MRFTEEGLKDLKNRLKNWVEILNKKEIPIKAHSLGFGKFTIENQEELIGRIKELAEITNIKITIKTTIDKLKNQTIKNYEVIL